MNLDEYSEHDALGLAELVRNGDLSAAELLETAKMAISEVDPELGFLVSDTFKNAERSVAAGVPDGPFSGVPFLKKDLGQFCKNIQSDFGCRLVEGFTPTSDSNFYSRIKQAGLVIVGRSAVPSFGGSGTTEPAYRGVATKNPWKPTHSSGGSSGGAAAAVASRALPISHTSDGGGSTRMPAAHCGLVGHKPTRGLLPSGPGQGELLGGFAVDGIVSRSLRDTAAFLDAVAGPDAGCRYFTPPPERTFVSTLDEAPRPLRIALNISSPARIAIDPDCSRAAEQAGSLLTDLGHFVDLIAPFPDAIDTGLAGAHIWAAHTAANTQAFATLMGRSVTPETVEPAIYAMAEAGATVTALDLIVAYNKINELSRAFGRFFEQWDLLVEPATAIPAPPLGSIPDNKSNVTVEEWGEAIVPLNCFTNRANKAGLPANAIPWDVTDTGLPVGIQLMGPFGSDALCLQMGRQIELARPWIHRRPPVCVGGNAG